VLGRIGGDEFLLFLPAITHEKAREKAQEALSVFLQTDWPYEEKPTVSIGVSYYPKHASDFLQLYACADSALYQAKAAGKRSVAEFDEKRLGGVCQSFTHAKNAAQAKYTAQAESAENAEGEAAKPH
jgi:predicted signal transduction protein with EAL and GGDEF domain